MEEFILKVPATTAIEITLVRWNVRNGAIVTDETFICEFEIKSHFDGQIAESALYMPALRAGILRHLIADGQTVVSGQEFGRIELMPSALQEQVIV